MAAGAGAPDRKFLDAAERDARAIEREQLQWSAPLADLIRGCAAAARRDLDGARTMLVTAEAGFERADMAVHAAVARGARGAVTGGDEGRALVVAADRWMIEQGVRNPVRMRAMHAPGLRAERAR